MKSMMLTKIGVENFRLLAKIELELEELTTLIVGRNNSGKTSLYEILRRFLDDGGRGFKIEDFSTACYCDFLDAARAFSGGEDEEIVRRHLPSIRLRLTFKYDPTSADFGAMAPLIVDLDPDANQAVAVLQYGLRDGRLAQLFADLPDNLDIDEGSAALFRSLRLRVPENYGMRFWAEDPSDPDNTRNLQPKDLTSLLDSGFINAQRGLDNDGHGEADVLGRVLEQLFLAAREPNADPKDKGLVEELEKAIEEVQSSLDGNVKGQLDELLPPLRTFGFGALNDAQLLTETTLDVVRLLSNFTKVRYAGHSGVALPESYNGLGVRNLILILMRIVSYYKRFRASADAPGLQVIFIEEPEAHLHPQMQEVFIRKLEKLIDDLAAADGDNVVWPVQFVVSTHSSHVANEAGFESIRYFLCKRSKTDPKIRHAEVKDLRSGLNSTSHPVRDFLHKYLTLTRCDLFFADKAVLVEGMSERLMIPVMIEKLQTGEEDHPEASSQYTTVMEVGGAYAHLFFDLLDFLELKTLIVTDLDSVAQEDGEGSFKAVRVHQGSRTSNATIKAWFADDNPCEIAALLAKSAEQKCQKGNRIAYQVADHETGACGRTFEDAFILRNVQKFGLVGGTREELEEESASLASESKKSEFALVHAITDTDWATPKYIREGLEWLFANAADAQADHSEAPDGN